MAFVTIIILFIMRFFRVKRQQNKCFFRAKVQTQSNDCKMSTYNRPKPEWVKEKIIHIKAIMGEKVGCRKIAECFNRSNHKGETVGKTYVANLIAKHQYEIHIERRKIKNKLPRWVAANCTWHVQQLRSTLLGRWI